MAVFMPLESNLPHLSFNNILKLQTPTQIFKQFIHKQDINESYMSNTNFFGNSNVKIHETSHNMTEEKHKSASMHLEFHHPEESTDSDLSVGQEKLDDDKSDNNFDQMDSEAAENRSINNVLGDGDEDNSSTASSSHLTNMSSRPGISNLKEVTEGAIQLSLFQPSPARLQEEIIRNSQLYAEELVRQQLAVSARLQSISGSKIFPQIDPVAFKDKTRLILSSTQEDLEPSLTSKLSFQSNVFAPKTIDHNQNGSNLFCNNKSAINFQNIHSHLSAISQITNNLTSSLKKDDSTSLSSISRESSQSPSNFQHLKHHHQQNMIFHTHQNQLHERNLKFSIDNILKADFGRRITEPLLRSSRPKKAHRDGKQDKDVFKKFNAPAVTKESFSSRDDNLGASESLPRNQSPSSEQGKGENSNGSKVGGSGTVWPAWVSQTRSRNFPQALITNIESLFSSSPGFLYALLGPTKLR
jgi:hypothetical protein